VVGVLEKIGEEMKIYNVRIQIEVEDYIAAETEEDAQEVLSDNIDDIMENPDHYDTDFSVVESVGEYIENVVPYAAPGVEEKTLKQWHEDGCKTTPDNWVDPNQLHLGV
jgi:hypothetical protein